MQIIIMGCGRVGSQLANMLSIEGHRTTVIDRDPKSFNRLGKSYRGQTLIGFGYDKDILEKAGIENADAFAAVTQGDNRNIVAALIAKREYKVPIVVARIYDPVRAIVYNKLGITTISPTRWGANKIKELISNSHINTQASLGNGEVEIIEIEVPHNLVGRAYEKINVPGEIMVIAVTRLGRAFVPVAGSVLKEGDIIHVSVASESIPKLKGFLGI
ncbi:MAG: TrkA family potassium uptake protein [Actinobacteria bacterium]|nr:TrkA family potassium uptake protein [Actinomycetota bacterium]